MVNATPTKAVYSVSVNPHNDFHIVSHVDNQITIWDTRYFEKPVLTLLQARQISKVLWCPTRHNLLGTLQKDSGKYNFMIYPVPAARNPERVEPEKFEYIFFFYHSSGALHLHDIQHCGVGGSEETEPGALERTVAPPWSSPTSFSWHPSHVNRLLAISQQGKDHKKKKRKKSLPTDELFGSVKILC